MLFKIPLRLWKNVLLSFVLIGGEEGVLHVFKQKNPICLVRNWILRNCEQKRR